MNVGLLVLGSPFSTFSCHTALELAKELLNQGHHIHRIFFYQDAVLIGNRFIETVNSSDQCQKDWIALAKEHALDLTICISAAQRRGINNQGDCDNVADGFSVSGLGQWIETTLVCDRLVTVP